MSVGATDTAPSWRGGRADRARLHCRRRQSRRAVGIGALSGEHCKEISGTDTGKVLHSGSESLAMEPGEDQIGNGGLQ